MNFSRIGVLGAFLFLTSCAGETPKLGVENGKLLPCPSTPNCVNSQVNDNEHFIKPFVSTTTQLQTQEKIIQILNDAKNVQIIEVNNNYIRAEFTSSVFRFVDDVEFYFHRADDKKVIVHIRSASRIGRSDFGVNRERIEKIRNALQIIKN